MNALTGVQQTECDILHFDSGDALPAGSCNFCCY